MGKTRADEEYEAGVYQGQRGGFLGDLVQSLTRSGSPFDKGYEHGAVHRYGPEGRYHTSDNRGSNDPKSKEVRAPEKITRREHVAEEPPHREAEYCSICGNEYDGDYCYECEDEEEYNERYEPPKPTRQQVIAGRLAGKKEGELMEIVLGNYEKDLKSAASERLAGIRGHLNVYHRTSSQTIKRALDSELYSGVTFVPPNYLCRYKCSRCGHEWDDIKAEYDLIKDNLVNCRMGCSSGDGEGDGEPSLLGLYKIIKGLITGKEPFGYGKLVKREKL